jgi:DNA-binding transcriptional ArsR family regulator
VAYIVDERYVPVYLPLEEVRPLEESQLIGQCAAMILARLEVIGLDTYRIPPFPPAQAPSQEWRRWFAEDFLPVATTVIRRDRFLLLLLDDWQRLYTALDQGDLPADFMAYWGALLGQYERLDMIVAVDIAEEQRTLTHPLTANINQHFRLVMLEDSAALQLMTDPIQGAYAYTPQALGRLQALCGGYPFLIHSLCRLIYRHHQQNTHLTHIAPEFIEVLYPAALQETEQVMENFWKNSTPNMQAVLRVLLAAPQRSLDLESLQLTLLQQAGGLNPTQVVATLRRLEYWGVIRSDEQGQYQFNSGLEADWLAEKLADIARVEAAQNPLKPSPWVGLIAVVAALVVLGGIIALGLLNGGDEQDSPQTIPPSATFEQELNLSPTISPTLTASVTRTPWPPPSPSATRTLSPSLTATASSTRTATERPSTTRTAEASPTRTPRPTQTEGN